MSSLLPIDFCCSNAVRISAEQKLNALEAVTEELPVYIIHDVRDFSVVFMSKVGLRQLGVTQEELRGLGGEYHTRFFNESDVNFYLPKFIETLSLPGPHQWFSFFQQVATGKEREFEWHLSASRPFVYDEDGKALLTLTFALLLDPNHHLAEKAERLMDENLLLRENYSRFASLTRRERELMPYIVSGEKPVETSQRLSVSEETINTHRRNIKRKIGAKTSYDILKFAQAFNLVKF